MIIVEINGKLPRGLKKIKPGAEEIAKKIKMAGTFEVTFVSEKKIKQINRHYRGKNSVTDAIAFSWQDALLRQGENKENLGEIYVCWNYIKKQAKNWGVTPREELWRALTHGILHLAGFDHVKKAAAKKMFFVQEKILQEIKTRYEF